jgi:adenylate cyclase
MIQLLNRAIRLDATKCRVVRARKGLSREQLATDSKGGISVATIKRLEKGVPVYLDTARRFAALLGVSVAELASGSDLSASTPTLEIAGAPATVAVLPFEVMGGGWRGRCFADGLVDDLITRMGRLWFPVISRGSTFHYRETRREAERLRLDLGVDYVVEGSVRRSAGTVRVNARLTDTRTAQQVWGDTYDRPYQEIFSLQTALVSTILTQAGAALVETEAQRRFGRDPRDLTAWELALRGAWLFYGRTKDTNAAACSLFEQALRRERALPLAWYGLAMTHQRAIVNQWSLDVGHSLRAMKSVCADFRREYAGHPALQIASAYIDIYAGDRGAAAFRLREALEVDPNATTAYCLYGQTLAMDDKPDEAIEQFELAMRLSPRDQERWRVQTGIALCHFVAGRYQHMLQAAKRTVETQPDVPFAYGTLAVARTYLDDLEGARDAVSAMLALEPNTSVRGLSAIVTAIHPDVVARYVSALQRAGVPG